MLGVGVSRLLLCRALEYGVCVRGRERLCVSLPLIVRWATRRYRRSRRESSIGQLDVCCEVSCPQLLDAPLWTIQTPVDQERIGVGCYLSRDPGCQPDE